MCREVVSILLYKFFRKWKTSIDRTINATKAKMLRNKRKEDNCFVETMLAILTISTTSRAARTTWLRYRTRRFRVLYIYTSIETIISHFRHICKKILIFAFFYDFYILPRDERAIRSGVLLAFSKAAYSSITFCCWRFSFVGSCTITFTYRSPFLEEDE